MSLIFFSCSNLLLKSYSNKFLKRSLFCSVSQICYKNNIISNSNLLKKKYQYPLYNISSNINNYSLQIRYINNNPINNHEKNLEKKKNYNNSVILLDIWKKIKNSVLHGIQWTKNGLRLFVANFKVSTLLVKKKIKGKPLTYREHKLLVRTTYDSIKLIPFSFFILIPFAELLLPVALWLFPNMLPSTFSLKKIDNSYLSRKLEAKQELANFFQELLAEKTKEIIDKQQENGGFDKVSVLKNLQNKLISQAKLENISENKNLFLSLEETLKYAKVFKEEFKIDKIPTKTLTVVCHMLGLKPYSRRSHLILQLRHHIIGLQREDREIMWEGVHSLTHEELVEACRDRAMKFFDVSDKEMILQLNEWLKLSSHKDIPPLLLLWSRSVSMFHTITDQKIQTETNEDILPIMTDKNDSDEPKEEEEKEDILNTIPDNIIKKNEEDLIKTERQIEELSNTATLLQQKLDINLNNSSNENSINKNIPIEFKNINEEEEEENPESLKKMNLSLEKELHLQHDISEVQHEQTRDLLQSITDLIAECRQNTEKDSTLIINTKLALADRLENILAKYEQGADTTSGILDSAKDEFLSENIFKQKF